MEGFEESSRIFEEDDKGYIWIAHAYRGLYRLKPDYEQLEFVEIRRFGKADGLPDDLYLTVSKVRGELVFTSPQGIYSYNDSTETFYVHKELTGLLGPDLDMQRIIEDREGNVWFSTGDEFGLVKILANGLFNDVEVLYFNEIQDDLVDGFEGVFSLDDGLDYIPTEDGFYRFDPKRPLPTDFSYPLLITKVYVTSFEDSLLTITDRGQTSGAEAGLDPQLKDLRFHYTMPVYGELNRAEYRYALENYDDEWSDWTTNTAKDYGNLDPGDYVFKVQARNSFGYLSSEKQFAFTILPPWYATDVAKTVFGLLVLLIMGGFVRFISLRESRKAEEVKKESIRTIKEKEEEFQKEKEKSRTEIIKLRNEKLRAEVSHKNAELASTTMHLVQKSEILQQIKKDIEEIAKSAQDGSKEKLKRIGRAIEEDVRLDRNWERFETHFDRVHENFFKNLRAKYPELTPKDQKLCAYLRMNLATKEIAPLLNISVRGVEISRYRLRKKLDLDSDTNLVSFMMEI